MLDKKIITILKRTFPFMNDLGEREDLFFNSLYYQKYESGTTLLDESHECKNIIFVISGTIRIYKLSEDGKVITLYRIGKGETCVLTVSCLLGTGDVPFPVAGMAEQTSEVVFMPIDPFRKLFFEVPSIQKYFFTSMSAKFYSILNLLENITFKRTSDRLLDFLLTKTSGGAYPLYSTHESIASELGTSREVISRLLKEMEGQGKVSLSRGKIVFHPR